MGFISDLQSYAEKWQESKRISLKKLDPKGFKDIDSAEVTEKEQEWGISHSICLFMKSGARKYIPLSKYSDLETGDEVDVNSIEIITLERSGDDPISRGDGKVLDSDDSDDDEDEETEEEEEEEEKPKKKSKKGKK